MPTDQMATEVALIRRIARRALDSIAALRSQGVLSVDIQADLAACHFKACPLRLEALLATDTLSFASDVLGIRRHIDRDTRILTGGYRPRFSQRPGVRQPPRDLGAAVRKQRQRVRDQLQQLALVAAASLSQGG